MEVHSRDVLHHHVIDILFVGEVINPDDIGMAQARGSPALAEKAVEITFVVDSGPRQDLDRPPLTGERVLRKVDGAHSACSQQGQQFVLSDEKPLILAGQQLVVVPLRDQTFANQELSQLVQMHRFSGSLLGKFGQGLLQPFCGHDPALLHQPQKTLGTQLTHLYSLFSGAWSLRPPQAKLATRGARPATLFITRPVHLVGSRIREPGDTIKAAILKPRIHSRQR